VSSSTCPSRPSNRPQNWPARIGGLPRGCLGCMGRERCKSASSPNDCMKRTLREEMSERSHQCHHGGVCSTCKNRCHEVQRFGEATATLHFSTMTNEWARVRAERDYQGGPVD
jgi:hypothetical protein